MKSKRFKRKYQRNYIIDNRMKRKAIILGQSIAFFFICSLVLFPYQAIAQTKQLVSLEMDWVMIENGSGFKSEDLRLNIIVNGDAGRKEILDTEKEISKLESEIKSLKKAEGDHSKEISETNKKLTDAKSKYPNSKGR